MDGLTHTKQLLYLLCIVYIKQQITASANLFLKFNCLGDIVLVMRMPTIDSLVVDSMFAVASIEGWVWGSLFCGVVLKCRFLFYNHLAEGEIDDFSHTRLGFPFFFLLVRYFYLTHPYQP